MTRIPLALSLAVALAACGGAPEKQASVPANDAGALRDPALASALRDQIMVDPALVQQANADAVRPPVQPASGALPPDDIAARGEPAEKDKVRPAPPPGRCPQCTAARRALTLGALAESQGFAATCVATSPIRRAG
ncbi:MAG: hypothetical protein QM688_13635, partial [Sphingomonas bacterium]